jgi:hypothetical protein
MSYERIKAIEDYLSNNKKKKENTPDNIRNARTHLIMVSSEMSEEELSNVKIYYQGLLATFPSISNLLATLAIAVSIFAGLLSIASSFGDAENKYFQPLILVLLAISTSLLILLRLLIKKISEASKKCDTYTIIINLIDEVLNSDSAKSKSKLSQRVMEETIKTDDL